MSVNPYAKRSQMAPAARVVRAYAAPSIVSPASSRPMIRLHRPASIWMRRPGRGLILVGWRTSSEFTTKYDALRTGPAANIAVQCRTLPEAHVEFDLLSWGKVQLALSGGTQQMNVLAEQAGGGPQPSGGPALPSSPVQSGSTITEILLTTDQLNSYSVGDIVAVDVDYSGQTGYLGSGAPGTYVGRLWLGGRMSTWSGESRSTFLGCAGRRPRRCFWPSR